MARLQAIMDDYKDPAFDFTHLLIPILKNFAALRFLISKYYSRFVGRIETNVSCYESISAEKNVLSLFKMTIFMNVILLLTKLCGFYSGT